MVKKSSMVSPEKPVEAGVHEGGGAEVDEGEWDSDGDGNETWHDAPDVTSNSPTKERGNTQHQHQAPGANMGNATSAEERSALIHAAAEEVRKKNGGAKTPGKLNKPSASARNPNPQYRNPVASAQRQLPPVNRNRKSAYDLDEEPPATLGPPKAQWADSRPEVSPRKADKRKARRGNNAGVEAAAGADEEVVHAEQDVSPKRNNRSSTLAQRTAEAIVEEAAPEAQMDDYLERMYEEEKEADAGADENDDNITVADRDANASEGDGPDPKSTTGGEKPRKRGRPAKPATTVPDESPKKAKKLGRPARSSDVAAKGISSGSAGVKTGISATETGERVEPTTDQGRLKRTTRSANAQEQSTTDPSPAESRVQTRSTRSKLKEQSTGRVLANLHTRRYSQVDGENQPENDDAEAGMEAQGGQGGQEDDSLFVPGSSQRPLAGHHADHADPAELSLSGSEDEDELHVVQPSSKKRKAGSEAARPNTGKKRRRSDQTTQQTETREADDGERANARRLFGQWPAFQEVLKKSDEIGRPVRDGLPGDRRDVDLRDADVKATVRLCNQAIRRYRALRTHSGPIETDQEPADLLGEISERIDGLRGKNKDYPTNLNDRTKATDIYYNLVRKLVDLVKASIVCYEARDTGAEGEGQISMGHLKIVNQLMKRIVDLVQSAQNYARPPTRFHLVQPVREMLPRLENISHALSRRIHHYELGQQTSRRQEQERRDRIAQREEDARRAQEEARASRLRQKWQKLHTERMLIEGGLMRASKRAHLAIPDEYHTEYDHNGIPFEREEIFHPRIGPPPDLVEAALKQQWSLVELSALSDGLKAYTGEHVFERTFRRYCGPGRELNKYNVTDIVAMAVQVKERLVDDQRRKYGDVEQWILDVPVWTRGQHGEGQENEDAVEVVEGDGEGDLTMSGGNGEA